jgi:hypothetical protein
MINQTNENTMALKTLGIKTGVTYRVVPVSCTQRDCVYYDECRDNAIGLTDDEKGNFMICHMYKTDLLEESTDKRVYWKWVGGNS